MTTQHTTPLWQAIMHSPMPEPAKRVHIGLGEHRHVWLDSDMRHFAHQIAEPIEKQRDELLAALGSVLSLVDRDAPQLSGKVIGAARAAIAKAEAKGGAK